MNFEAKESGIRLRRPVAADAKSIRALVAACTPLDLNSTYAYLLLCVHFSDTCVVAEQAGRIVGFVSGYVQPNSPETLFIWQVAVDPSTRGGGLGRAMLVEVLLRESCRNVTRLETTVSPSNDASRRMFEGVAKRIRTDLNEEPCFDASLLGDTGHEDENLVTIGPIRPMAT